MAASRLPDVAAPAVAADPSTSPDTLRRLARHRDRDVRNAVARNPNTPVAVLGSLGRLFPEALAQNPVLDWLGLEDANWLSEFDDRAREQLLSADGVADSLLWWSARSGSDRDRLAVAANRHASLDVLHQLRNDVSTDVSVAASHHARSIAYADVVEEASAPVAPPRIPTGSHVGDLVSLLIAGEMPTWLVDAIALDDIELRRAVAAWPGTPRPLVLRLCVDDDADVRTLARANGFFDPAIQTLFAAVDHSAIHEADRGVELGALLELPQTGYLRLASASHPGVAPQRLTELASDAEWRVRERAAANPSIGEGDAVRLAADADKDVRVAVARNPATPSFVVELLCTDRVDEVRGAASARRNPSTRRRLESHDGLDLVAVMAQANESVRVLHARHPTIDPQVLSELATDTDWRVREAVACNPSCTPELLGRLSADTDPDVRRCAVTHAETTRSIIESRQEDDHDSVRLVVARRTTSPAVLRTLSSDRGWAVREEVSRNRFAPADAILALAADADTNVRAAVATRSDLGKEALAALTVDADSDLRLLLLHRHGHDPEVVRLIFAAEGGGRQAERYRRFVAGQLRSAELVTLLRRSPWLRDPVLATAPSAALPDVLVALSRSEDWRTRVVVGAHPSTPIATLQRLGRDTDYDVRSAVAAHPRLPAADAADLAEDVHGGVRAAIAARADSDPATLAKFVFDEDDAVRQVALHHCSLEPGARPEHDALMSRAPVAPDVLDRLAGGGALMRQRVAEHPESTPRVLRRLVRDDAWRVREAVALHARATCAMLIRLAGDSDRDVRRAVAANVRTPSNVLCDLLQDGDASVRNAAIANRSVPQLERTLALRETLRRLLRSQEQIASVVIAANVTLHPSMLGRRGLWRSPLWWVRLALARNPATPSIVMGRLCEDAHAEVRAAAVLARAEASSPGAA